MAEKSADVTRVKAKWKKPKGHDPSPAQAAELQAELEKLESKYGKELFRLEYQDDKEDGLGQPMGKRANEYPTQLFSRDAYDNVADMKARAPESLGKKMLTTDDLGKWQKKNKIA